MAEPVRIANRYELGRLIGTGGMGRVYHGRDAQTGEPVAVKELRPDILASAPELAERFRREGEALRRLNHPNIVKVLAAVEEGGQLYIVMEHVGGGSLSDLLKRQPQLPLERALAIALETSDALARTHHLHIVHRDIKPGNVLLAEDGTPRLSDFGLAFLPDRERLTMDRAVLGTFQYMSPELCEGQKPGERSDIWAFGVTLYEMLAGRPPFRGDSPAEIIRDILDGAPAAVSEFRSDAPPALDALIRRMLMKDAVARIASFRQIGAELEAIARGARVPQWPRPPAAPESPPAQASAGQMPQSPTPGAAPITPRLLTKLFTPDARPEWIDRPRLYERLDQAAARGFAVLSAPAGYGKTALLAGWLRRPAAPRAAWVSLDAADNDPVRFWADVLAALRTLPAFSSAGQGFSEWLHAPQPPPLDACLVLLLNEITQAAAEVILVLDDYHAVTEPAVHASLDYCLEHLPANLHPIIASRAEVPVSLPRHRARGRLVELRARDLRFTRPEVGEFLGRSARLELGAEDVAELERRTEGWIAGLQLAAILMQDCDDRAAFVQSFGGDQSFIYDYLTEEVLRRQPEPVQSFLLRTSILDRLSAPLCEALVASDGQAMLDFLTRANLFVAPLDNRRQWHRYHPLFAELLRARLQQAHPDEFSALHRRAAAWFAANRLPEEAIKHAVAGGDAEAAADGIEQHQRQWLDRGEIATLRRWLDALPAEPIQARPALCLGYAYTELYQLRFDQAGRWASRAEAAVAGGDEVTLGHVDAVRATIAINRQEFEQALELSQRALQRLPADMTMLRALVNLNLGDAQRVRDDHAAAEDAYRSALEAVRAGSFRWLEAVVVGSLGDLFLRRGRLRQAASLLEQVAQAEQDRQAGGDPPLLSAGKPLAFLTRVYTQWNRLEDAARAGERAVDYCRAWRHVEHLKDACLNLAELRQAQGDAPGCEAVLAEADALMSNLEAPARIGAGEAALGQASTGQAEVSLMKAWLRLLQGDRGYVERWLEQALVRRMPSYFDLHPAHVLAWHAILRGHPERAIQPLEALAENARQKGWLASEVRTLAMLACARRADGGAAAALATLERALRLAEPEGFVRAFVDKGEAMADLLEKARRAGGAMGDYASRLLAAFERAGAPPASPAAALSLTERESQILRLLAAGRSYPEIASALFLSVNTVKTHVKRLYDKLGVDSRLAAVEAARAMNVIG
jgi:LuxR family maltose regulon positive regulatory protein